MFSASPAALPVTRTSIVSAQESLSKDLRIASESIAENVTNSGNRITTALTDRGAAMALHTTHVELEPVRASGARKTFGDPFLAHLGPHGWLVATATSACAPSASGVAWRATG